MIGFIVGFIAGFIVGAVVVFVLLLTVGEEDQDGWDIRRN